MLRYQQLLTGDGNCVILAATEMTFLHQPLIKLEIRNVQSQN